MNKLKVGIAGFGVVGKRRRKFIDEHPNMKVTAVCDITFAGDGKLEDGVNFYKSYVDLLKEDLDVLFVCLTNDIAPTVTMGALERGFHVFCEKPPGRTVSDIKRVREVEANNPHLKLMYGFNHRYHDSVRTAKEIIESGNLGKIINIRGVYGKSKIADAGIGWRAQRDIAGGGILLDQGIHMVDLFRFFAGEFVEFKSYVSNEYWGHNVEDNAYALMKSKSGIVGFLNSTATEWRHRFSLEISLTEGSIHLTGILSGSKSYGAETIKIAYRNENDAGDPKEITTRYNADPSWQDEIEHFASAILNNEEINSGSSWDALQTMKMVYEIYCADSSWKKRYNLSSE